MMNHSHPVPPPIQPLAAAKFSLACPFCKTPVLVSPSEAGSTTTCANCSGRFQIPLPTAGQPSHGGDTAVRAFASNKIAAGVCGIMLGAFGVHKFILGLNTGAVIMLATTLVSITVGSCLVVPILAAVVMSVIGIVEGVVYLTKSDEEFYQAYAVEKKQWF